LKEEIVDKVKERLAKAGGKLSALVEVLLFNWICLEESRDELIKKVDKDTLFKKQKEEKSKS